MVNNSTYYIANISFRNIMSKIVEYFSMQYLEHLLKNDRVRTEMFRVQVHVIEREVLNKDGRPAIHW